MEAMPASPVHPACAVGTESMAVSAVGTAPATVAVPAPDLIAGLGPVADQTEDMAVGPCLGIGFALIAETDTDSLIDQQSGRHNSGPHKGRRTVRPIQKFGRHCQPASIAPLSYQSNGYQA